MSNNFVIAFYNLVWKTSVAGMSSSSRSGLGFATVSFNSYFSGKVWFKRSWNEWLQKKNKNNLISEKIKLYNMQFSHGKKTWKSKDNCIWTNLQLDLCFVIYYNYKLYSHSLPYSSPLRISGAI